MIDVAVSQFGNYTPVFNVNISVDNLNISIEDVNSWMSDTSLTIDAHFHDTINDIFLHLPDKCHINAGYVLYPAYFDQVQKKNLKIGDTFFNMGKTVINRLKNSEQIAIFACTIGPNLENWSKKAMAQGDAVQSYLIDMVASVVTEKAEDYLYDCIGAEMAKKNLNMTNRYSPGYCDWPVSDQHLLFSLMPEDFCRIRLNTAALMNPIKSVSGVIGIGPKVHFEENLCDCCNIKDCTYHLKYKKI